MVEATAKCPLDHYSIDGAVESEDGVAITDAHVVVFLDGASTTDAAGVSSTSGEYRVTTWFDSFKRSSVFGDKCGRAPKSLELVVFKDGFLAVRQRLTKEDFEIKEVEIGKQSIALGALVLERRPVESGLEVN